MIDVATRVPAAALCAVVLSADASVLLAHSLNPRQLQPRSTNPGPPANTRLVQPLGMPDCTARSLRSTCPSSPA